MSLLVVGMDVTIVNVALPSIQRDLHATVSGLQWILDAYTLVVASFLMLAGSISDRVGGGVSSSLVFFSSPPDRCSAAWPTLSASSLPSVLYRVSVRLCSTR